MGMLEEAIILAAARYNGVRDKGNMPYILHVLYVVTSVDGYEEKVVAALHDLVEDGHVSLFYIAKTFNTRIADAVDAISKRHHENYLEDYIPRVADNKIATKVKLLDLLHNMDLSRIRNPTEVDYKRHDKYMRAYKYLLDAAYKNRYFEE